MVIDSHVHIFSSRIVNNVARIDGLAETLHLETDKAEKRCDIRFLENQMQAAGVAAALLLPTAPAPKVEAVNSEFIHNSEKSEKLFTAGTLHPAFSNTAQELERLRQNRIKALKFSTFSQGFRLVSEESFRMFHRIQQFNDETRHGFFIVLDTFARSHQYFGTDPAHTTTPALTARVVRNFPRLNFIAAHMGGLKASFDEIEMHLTKRDNLYLDTSNAAHTLSEKEFITLLRMHGPEKILFGTDWPWFHPQAERGIIDTLAGRAGFGSKDKDLVFAQNSQRLLRSPSNTH